MILLSSNSSQEKHQSSGGKNLLGERIDTEMMEDVEHSEGAQDNDSAAVRLQYIAP